MWNRNMFNYKILSTVYCELFTATFFGTKHMLISRIYILNVWFAAKNDRTTVITILAKFSRTQIKVDVQYSTYIQLKFFILAKVIETKRKINNKFHFQIPYISAEIRLGWHLDGPLTAISADIAKCYIITHWAAYQIKDPRKLINHAPNLLIHLYQKFCFGYTIIFSSIPGWTINRKHFIK